MKKIKNIQKNNYFTFSAKDIDHNNAVVLKEVIEK
ncbi:MAG: hypothetical protein KatS3mg096_563 [Candidatus Parcubacteria bacterium]|nr:MAG: hypothetical protein KatS3mg096_563 [Candidatus Parcubacteria bacterium]